MNEEQLRQEVSSSYDAWQLAITSNEPEKDILEKQWAYEVADDNLDDFLQGN
jgi:hypothetical protein